MTRAAILALAALAALAWSARRREPRWWPHPFAEDRADPAMDAYDVQPPDPWPDAVMSDAGPAWEPDPPYLEALPLARMRAAYQGRPLGGT